MQTNSFSKNSLTTFLTEIAIFALSFFATIILARILGPTGKGIYSLILLVPGLLLTFGSFGIDSANVYFVSSKKYKIQDVASNSLSLSLLLGVILILIFWAIYQFDFFQKFLYSNQIPSLYLWLAVLIIPVVLISSFFRSIIRGRGHIITCNKIRFTESVVLFLGVVVFLLLIKGNIFGAVLSYILSILVAAFLGFFLVRKTTKIHFSLNKKLLKDSTIYGGKVYLADALSFLNYRSDMFFIAFFLTPAAVGFYSIAVSMVEKLFIISGSFAMVLFPKIASVSEPEANNFTPKVARHTFFIMLISSLLLFFLVKPLITLVFGSAFLPAVLPLIILLPGIIAFGIGGVLAADLSGRGKPEYAVYASFACLVIDTILNFIFIPKWGISGASFASSVSYWVDTLIMLVVFSKISKKPLVEVLLIKKEDFQDYLKIFSNFKSWIKVNKNK